jgi:hypothetical protein
MWCGGGHLHKECPGKGNTALIPTCNNSKLVDDVETHPSNYRSCRHAKEQMRKRKLQSAQDYNGKGVLFQPHYPRTILRGGTMQQNTAKAAASAALSCTGHHGFLLCGVLGHDKGLSTKAGGQPGDVWGRDGGQSRKYRSRGQAL